MYQFIETIQLFQGALLNLEFHQVRFERTRRKVLGLKHHPRLAEAIMIPEGLNKGQIKCRVSYGKVIGLIEFEPQPERKINSLKLVHSDSIDYEFKYTDRSELESLFMQRGDCDDILVIKKGYVTDSLYANVVFWDGDVWITPDTPLLEGCMRASLLNKGMIIEDRVTPDDLNKYEKLKLISAMNDLQLAPEIPIDSIAL
jgi:4-amino-4-deoxychorismate lyase